MAATLVVGAGCANGRGADEMLARGDAAYGQGSYASARAKYARLIKAHPSHEKLPHVRFQIGRSYFEQRQWLMSIAAFEDVIAHHPESSEVWDALYFGGIAYGKLGRCVDASTWLGKLNEGVAVGVPEAQRYADKAQQQLDLVNDDMSGLYRFCKVHTGAS